MRSFNRLQILLVMLALAASETHAQPSWEA